MTLRQAAREREWWLLAAVIVVVFHRALTTGTLFFRDIYELFIPNAIFLARSLHAGTFPLWDPRVHGGIPFTSPANSPFYPTNILYAFLPPLAAFNLILVAHVVFASLAAYWLARLLGMSRRAAVVAGAAYALSGVLLSTLNLVPIALAMPWVPVTIGRLHRRELPLAAVCAAMPLLAGAAEVTAMMFVVLIAWVIATQKKGDDAPRAVDDLIAGPSPGLRPPSPRSREARDNNTTSSPSPQSREARNNNTTSSPSPQSREARDNNTTSSPSAQSREARDNNTTSSPAPQSREARDNNTTSSSSPQSREARDNNTTSSPSAQSREARDNNTTSSPSPRLRGEGARRADEGCVIQAEEPGRVGAAASRGVLAVAFIALFAAALSLVQILPGLQMMKSSSRSLRRDFNSFAMWSVDPRRLPELIIPQFLGRTDALDEREYWGRNIESNGFPYILSIYFGALLLLLAIAGAVVPRDSIPCRTLAAIALLSLALAIGRALPFLRIVYEIFPPVAIFRYPVKALIASLVPIALLASSGLAALEEGNERARHIVLYGAYVVIALIVILEPICAAPLDPIVRPMLFRRMLQPVIVLALTIVALRFRRAGTIAALVVLDLAIAGSGVNAVAPRWLFDEPPVARAVRQLAGDSRFTHVAEPFAIDLHAPSDDIRHLARFKLETLDGYTAATFGIPVVFHTDYDGLAPLAISQLTNDLPKLRWRDRIPIFAVAGVRVFMTSDQLRTPGVVPVFRFMSADGKWRNVYTIPSAATVRFVSRVEFVPDVDAMRRRIEGGFDPSTLVLAGNHAPIAGCGTAIVRGNVVDAPCDGYVLLSDTFDPGWRYRVDSGDVNPIRADYTFTAIPVAAGHHVIARRFVPAAFYAGLTGSIVALLILIGIAWRS
jgi:hypothetical protein